jgi:hypothetical protein
VQEKSDTFVQLLQQHERYATSDMAHAANSAQLAQRAEKKAARRAAFIQEIAEAVCSLGVQRQNEIEATRRALSAAQKAARFAQETANHAAYDSQHPLEAAYYTINPGARNSLMFKKHMPRITLNWVIEEGILPVGTTELPDVGEQYLALARRPTSEAVAQD